MKWIALFPIILLTACGYYNSEVVDYKEVVVTPPPYESVTYVDEEPLNVTTTEISYY
ncbi:Uncharacterised protein [Legionella busanensis]|uniref:Lipoprotein n=1 Tax=Legionella busanensis TaxID=190655 RepID=A0A378JWQ4_9GAMM|nr:hypothetical protein [Legionella busanensis]STX52652.1 Uncharacterised protein [Legionella busanensis]